MSFRYEIRLSGEGGQGLVWRARFSPRLQRSTTTSMPPRARATARKRAAEPAAPR